MQRVTCSAAAFHGRSSIAPHGTACNPHTQNMPMQGSTAISSMPQAELAVMDALRSARGRGKEGLTDEALAQLNLAVSVLESDGGVAGEHLLT